MPRIKIQERHQKVQSDGGGEGNDEVRENVVTDLESPGVLLQLVDYDVQAGEGVVGHDYGIDYHGA